MPPVPERGEPIVDLDPDPSVWLIGPTPERPFEQWLPGATDVMCQTFGLTSGNDRQVTEQILTRLGGAQVSGLPYLVIRWRAPLDPAVPLFFGLIGDLEPGDGEKFLQAPAEQAVEPPVVEDVDGAAPGVTIRRSLTYSQGADNAVVVGVRYAVEGQMPGFAVLAHTALPSPAQAIEALPDMDALVRTFTVSVRP